MSCSKLRLCEFHQQVSLTGLDPALPLFVTSNKNHKLDPSDAQFVDVFHCNVSNKRVSWQCAIKSIYVVFVFPKQGLMQGQIDRCGHVDFFMNGGVYQPGCGKGKHDYM